MSTYIDLTWRFPTLVFILRDAATCHDWTAAARLRARVRAIGMTKADQAVALGLLADAVGGER